MELPWRGKARASRIGTTSPANPGRRRAAMAAQGDFARRREPMALVRRRRRAACDEPAGARLPLR
jgi:hypothetical protein